MAEISFKIARVNDGSVAGGVYYTLVPEPYFADFVRRNNAIAVDIASVPTSWKQSLEQDARNAFGMPSLEAAVTGKSGYGTNDSGAIQSLSSLEQDAANERAVVAGTMRKVPVGNGFAYVPTGSAGAQNYDQNISPEGIFAKAVAETPYLSSRKDSFMKELQLAQSRGEPFDAAKQIELERWNAPKTVDEQRALVDRQDAWARDYRASGANPSGVAFGTPAPSTGQYFRSSSGDFVDSNGRPVTDPNIRLQISQSIGGELNNLPLFGSGNTTNSGQVAGATTSNPDLGPYNDLYKQMQDYLTKLQQNGQIINPNVAITPDQLAAFTTQAASQIHPYYATQLAAATDSFLSGLGYNTEQFKNSVQQSQQQYGRNLDTLSSNMADVGFAQSGIRNKKEGDLASDTQNNLDQMRSSLFNTSQNAARSFAQQYGGSGVPQAPTIGAAPRVLSGKSQFDTSGSQQGLYSLDPSIYSRLIGSEQNAEKQATDSLASQLATNANSLTANQQQRRLL